MYTGNKKLHKKSLTTAISIAIGAVTIPTSTLQADMYTFSFSGGTSPVLATDGVFTMLQSNGIFVANPDTIGGAPYAKKRSTINGTVTFDTANGTGTMSISAFSFFGKGGATATAITFTTIGDGSGGPGTLILGNMGFNWNANNGIPVSIVWDGAGLLAATLDGAGKQTTGNVTGGAVPASDVTVETTIIPGSTFSTTRPIGASPLATTTFNTTNIGTVVLGTNPSGTQPLITDLVNDASQNPPMTPVITGIGGTPMPAGPFALFNANFDFPQLTITSFTDTTPPVITIVPNTVSTPNGTPYNLITHPGVVITGTDNVDGDVSPSCAVVTDGYTGNESIDGNYIVTYRCNDNSANFSVPNQPNAGDGALTVTVGNPDAPVITLTGGGAINHECGTAYTDQGATVNDLQDGMATYTAPVAGPNMPDAMGGYPSTLDITNAINVTMLGGQPLLYDTTDIGTGNTPVGPQAAIQQTRTVTVVDTTNPMVVPNPPTPQPVLSSTPQNPAVYIDPMAIISDTCDAAVGMLSPINATGGVVNMVVPDTGLETVPNVISYSVTDASVNNTIVNRTINVTRAQPVITLVGGGSVTISTGGTYTELGMMVHDAQDADPVGAVTTNMAGTCGADGMTCTIDSSAVNSAVQGSYPVNYDVTDTAGNFATRVVRTVNVGAFAIDSNFTMLDGNGRVFGGTNDITFTYNGTTNPTTAGTNFNMTIASAKPEPFFGEVWTAHHVRVFGPGTYTFDTSCSVATLETTGCPGTGGGNDITMTVATGQLGAHMLFNWNTTDNIDVVNVWDGLATTSLGQPKWQNPDGATSDANDLWLGSNVSNTPPDPDTDWDLVSTDANGDGFNGIPMIDGPFQGFYANFNAGPKTAGAGLPPITTTTMDTPLGDDTLSTGWAFLLSLLPLLGLRRRHKK